MRKEKKYFWLKLKTDFFNQKEIKKLRKIAGGDTYTIIYLKMQLKSLSTDGSLFYEGFEDDFADELALEIDEEPENVRVTLLYLEKYNLIEKIENEFVDEFVLPIVKEITGSETASAVRVRKYRAIRAGKTLQCNIDVTQVKRTCNTHVTKCNIEREKELELDIERELEKDIPTIPEEFYKSLGEHERKTSHVKVKQDKDISSLTEEKKKEKDRGQKEKRKVFGIYENVYLEESKYKNLVNEYGEETINKYIERISNYVAYSGKKYKDFSAVMRTWMDKDGVIKIIKKNNAVLTDKEKQELEAGIIGKYS